MYIGLHVKYPFSDFNETCEYSRQIFEKYSNIKFHKNLSSGSCSVRTGRHDEANSRVSKFCECA